MSDEIEGEEGGVDVISGSSSVGTCASDGVDGGVGEVGVIEYMVAALGRMFVVECAGAC